MTAQSARGLFRATGKKAKPVALRAGDDLAGAFVRADHLPRDEDDFYPTPPDPVRAFLAVEGGRLRQFPLLWEPACGDGAMMREMRALGFSVFGSDIVDRGGCADAIRSFYDFDRDTMPRGAAIVTNPPYQECNWRDGRGRWLWHALDALGAGYMALLLPWNWPGAGGLAGLWHRHPPARAYLMRWKIDFTGQGAPPILNGWFVWDHAHSGEPVLRMLDRADARQGELIPGEGA